MPPSLNVLRRLGAAIIDLFYPPSCASCGADGAWWCADCRSDVERVCSNPCPRCLSVEAGHDQTACKGSLPFAGVVTTGYYHSPPLRKAIGDLKFRGVTAIRRDLIAYLMSTVDDRNFPWRNESLLAIQPIPLASRRERERGFNQSAVIAEILREALLSETDIVSRLSRVTSHTPQANIEDHALRSANVTGDFVTTDCGPEAVLLVDDVVTSGSTAGEAARALLAAGAPRVYLFALALGA